MVQAEGGQIVFGETSEVWQTSDVCAPQFVAILGSDQNGRTKFDPNMSQKEVGQVVFQRLAIMIGA